ncbi:MAG: carbamoyl phosphate synthase large subunit [Candidatus Marinimicrobia bacterium]|nr:carbamoyl phosphate synthase large subunit [Candidatus Neomarinimicrobiota bacterium]|tara:strand:+ start:17542 stop:20730 length:3189 start_codon:yes stop_codon:yes gene_type:complete
MPKRTDIQSIMIIGAGPIIIGQACEFDYSGTQACRALKNEGYRIILINSNPATIMTDKNIADATYLEPIDLDALENIIIKEKPDALLPTVGGQTALDAAMKLYKEGILKKYNVELIGANISAIEKAESRENFKVCMNKCNIETAKGGFVNSRKDALSLIYDIGFPVIIRPSFTMGGTGGSTAYNIEEFEEQIETGLIASPITEVLIEESLLGWKEFEMEVVRDSNDNAIIICGIENIDPMGVHTGDSITVAPIQTLSDKEYQKMRNWSIQCLKEIGVDTGGSNVQFAVHPDNGRMIIIEMNPRVSRSSALASKATGYPIAKIAAKLAIGYTLDEIPNDITGNTMASFEPSIDYVVTKIPRFDFEKFPTSDGVLGVQMQSVGEVMAIGRTFRESLQKAFRSLEAGLIGYQPKKTDYRDLDISKISFPTAFRLLKIWEAFKEGYSIDELYQKTKIDKWFLHQFKFLADLDIMELYNNQKINILKQEGFSDEQIACSVNISELDVRNQRIDHHITPTYKMVDTCAAEFKSETPYCYSTYELENEIKPFKEKSILILGGGPNRIGQGIEFDYCCVQAVFGLQELGFKTIMVNCNPETVSTDFDIADKLYFEPLTFEDVMNIIDLENPFGVLIQFGGQTPLNIANKLLEQGVNIIGTDPKSIDLAEDRKKFGMILDELNIPVPNYGTAYSIEEAIKIANKIKYPVLVRPSYVLGGRGMEIVYDENGLKDFVGKAALVSGNHPILIDAFLENAFEFDVDAICDGNNVEIAGIMQHIEEAGIHSGDSSCVFPAYNLTVEQKNMMESYTELLAKKFNTIGLINIQYAIQNDIIYVIEVNPRASRTIPFISKVKNIPYAKYAAQIATGKKINDLNIIENETNLIAVKKPVFPFNKFPNQNIFLSPEMRSTGEVIGLDRYLGSAYAKAEIGAGNKLPQNGTIFISVNNADKNQIIKIARDFSEMNFEIIATSGTANILKQNGILCDSIFKVGEGRPNVVDAIKNNKINLIINTPLGSQSRYDEYEIGKTSIKYSVPVITTIAAAKAALRAIRIIQNKQIEYFSLQSIFDKHD